MLNTKIELLQPWSTFVLKTQLPPDVLSKMKDITDDIVEGKTSSVSAREAVGAGEMERQYLLEFLGLPEELQSYFSVLLEKYIVSAFCQKNPEDKENILKQKWESRVTLMWINSQKDNEYFPLHNHGNAQISAVCYLDIPKYLPALNSPHTTPGAIEFISNRSNNDIWAAETLKIQPQIGDFYIFTIDQQHIVYPFKTYDGKGERRSVSFNAEFRTI